MNPTINFDMTQFQRDLRVALSLPGRSLPERLNSKAYTIARTALDATKRASRKDIESLGLKTVSVTPRITSKGRTRLVRKFKFEKDTAVNAYVGIRSKRAGGRAWLKEFASRADLAKQARRWIGKKLRSIGFLASTWRPILRALDKYAEQKAGIIPGNRHSNVKSYARPAREGWNPFVEFGNVVGEDKYGNPLRPYAQNLLIGALQKGFAIEGRNMAEYLAKKLKDDFRKEGAVVK